MATPTPASLVEFKAFLNRPTGDAADDSELEMTLVAATEAVEQWRSIGPIVPREVTSRVAANDSGALVLPLSPVRSVASVTSVDGGPSYAAADLTVRESGIVTARSGRLALGLYDVAYEAGRDPVPDALRLATLIIGKHLWETQRGPKTRLRTEDDESRAQWAGAGYLIPNRAAHLMQPYVTVPVA